MTVNSRKTRRAEALIVALLSHDTIAAAAKAAKVSEATALRWMQDDAFQRDYRAARRNVVEQSLATIQAATTEAVEALRRNLNCERPSVEVAAAQAIIGHAVKGVELIDLDERLAALESRFGREKTK